ncbi:MAG: hypothetical protein FWC23_08975 [Chitinispirillia bacterium]|nr:hypothetical protein [Chitinispirillia bacterium]MCL2269300.1 hypothetical protein [Chitinispirillia bacterium]
MMVIFIFLSIVILAFLVSLCLTLFKIERTVKLTMMFAERRILQDYGYKYNQPSDD